MEGGTCRNWLVLFPSDNANHTAPQKGVAQDGLGHARSGYASCAKTVVGSCKVSLNQAQGPVLGQVHVNTDSTLKTKAIVGCKVVGSKTRIADLGFNERRKVLSAEVQLMTRHNGIQGAGDPGSAC